MRACARRAASSTVRGLSSDMKSSNIWLASSAMRVEHVTLTVDITHPWRGDLAVTLTSPAGTVSRLLEKRSADSNDNFSNWKFMTVRGTKWKIRRALTLRSSAREVRR